jgi:hypothetical protein
MKKIITSAAAVALSTAALADVSISGAGQVNLNIKEDNAGATTNTVTHDFDLKIVGKSGDTSVTLDIENTTGAGDGTAASLATTTYASSMTAIATAVLTPNKVSSQEMNVKNAYLSTNIAGVDVKMGTWFGSDSLLGNGTQGTNQIDAKTTISGIGIQFEDNMTDSSLTLSGTFGGVSVSHEMFNNDDKTDTQVKGSYNGVSVHYRNIDQDTANSEKTSLEVNADIAGVTLTYADVDTDAGTTSDAFFGEQKTEADFMDATGFGIKTSLDGNTVQLRSYEITNTSNVATDHTKVIVTRPLASGATAEVTYHDVDGGDEVFDLELRIAF